MQHLTVTEEDTLAVIESLWYVVAEKLFTRVIEVTGLDKKREAALRLIALRPNDFRVIRTNGTLHPSSYSS
jgi:hypothetical protein